MKIATLYTLSTETVDAIRVKADMLGVAYSQLAELFIRFGLTNTDPTKLATWAQDHQRAKYGSKPPKVQPSQATMLPYVGHEWTRTEHLMEQSRQPYHVAWMALEGLRSRGLVEMQDVRPGMLNRKTGRPLYAEWRLIRAG